MSITSTSSSDFFIVCARGLPAHRAAEQPACSGDVGPGRRAVLVECRSRQASRQADDDIPIGIGQGRDQGDASTRWAAPQTQKRFRQRDRQRAARGVHGDSGQALPGGRNAAAAGVTGMASSRSESANRQEAHEGHRTVRQRRRAVHSAAMRTRRNRNGVTTMRYDPATGNGGRMRTASDSAAASSGTSRPSSVTDYAMPPPSGNHDRTGAAVTNSVCGRAVGEAKMTSPWCSATKRIDGVEHAFNPEL